MAEHLVWVFFYGSYMNLNVLREVNYVPRHVEVASVAGFDIRIAPRANLVRMDAGRVYGILATAQHDELQRLYHHAEHVLGERYLPEAVLAETRDGVLRPALCYIAPAMEERPAAADYVNRILKPAREHGFPAWYIARLERFLEGHKSSGKGSGNLFAGAEPPAQGERFEELLSCRNLRIERIVSSSAIAPSEYDQEQDEWVALLQGEATLDIGGERRELRGGDHVFLPAHTRHTVLRASNGALWLAIHLR